MRKKVILICVLSLITLIAFCGCSSNSALLEYIAGQSGEDIDADAQAIVSEANSAAEIEQIRLADNGKVLVSFAKNSNFNIKHSRSDAFSGDDAVADGSTAEFKKGDAIYATVTPATDNEHYSFSNFVICAVDGGKNEELASPSEKSGLIWTIPADSENSEFLIKPIGKYEYEKLSFEAKYISDDNDKTEITLTDSSCYWTVDETVCESNEKDVRVNPFTNYIVRFSYDSDKYFFISSEPKRFGTGDVNGEVSFYSKEQQETSAKEYSVVLRRYIDISAPTAADRKVLVVSKNNIVQGSNETTVKSGGKWEYSDKLKFGDTLKIRTDKEWNELAYQKYLKLRSDKPERVNGNFIYEVEVVHPSEKLFSFDPAEYSYQNGTVRFKLDGFDSYLDKVTLLEPGQKLIAEGYPESGYYLPDSKNVITISNSFEDTRAAIRGITFIKEEYSTVRLLQPEYGGRIRYFVNGTEQTSNEAVVKYGTVIEMRFEAQNHWKCDYSTAEYRVRNEKTQQTDINGAQINTAFKEDENYYPKLMVTLSNSVEKRSFSVQTASFNKSSLHYEGALTLLDDTKDLGKTQTTQGIKLTSIGHTYVDNKMIKVTVLKTGENGIDTEFYYMDRENSIDIPIYTPYGQTYYKTIELKISVSDKYVFMPNGALRSGHVSVSFTDNTARSELLSGDLVDGDRRVRVELIPDATYFVVGRNNSERYYEDMKYSQYVSRISGIISEHQIRKKYSVKLTESDEYGEFSYTVDGQAVSGTALLMDGQKLNVTYTVTAPSCAINVSIIEKAASRTYPITVDSNFIGISEISRSVLGIKVVAIY